MKNKNTLFLGSALFLLAACGGGEEATTEAAAPEVSEEVIVGLTYPETKTVEQTDDFYGTIVSDPYRWLEDDVRESEEVAEWVEAQNAVTYAYLDTLPMRDSIKARMTELWDYEKFSIPTEEGGKYFYRRNDGLQNQYVFYVQEGLNGEPRVLIDPNGWATDGATALSATSVSPGGEYVAYSIQDGGSDWRTVKVLNVESGETMDDSLEWVKFSGLSWHPSGEGFYYSRFPAPEEGAAFQSLNFDQKLYFHKLGTDQAEDALVFERADNPEIGVSGYVVDKRFLIVVNSLGTDDAYEIAVQDLEAGETEPTMIIEGFEDDYSFIGAEGRTLFVRTNRNAPKGRVVAIDLDNPLEENWTEVIPEYGTVLVDVSYVGGKLIAEYLKDVATTVLLFSTEGEEIGEVELPGLGTAGGFEGAKDNAETFYSYSSFDRPSTIYRYDVETGETEEFKAPELTFNPDDYVVEQVFYPSKDGREIPMFIAHKKDLDLSKGAPTHLYGYGGFNISIRPSFDVTTLAWMEMGGVHALANIRGGGEYGREWHDEGRLANKQNVFDDFIAAGEYLIAQGTTSKDQLAIRGRSNGGLLVGAVTNQRPDLFAAALPQVGVMDMLRFNKFTAGRYWTDDYGNPSESESDFKVNYAYSPYHNIKDGAEYPAVLVTTADTDDRVVPGHSFKYIAALQAAETGPAPKLIRIETRAGHGSGKPTDKIIEEFADMWAFIGYHTGLELPEGYGE
ncbi:prolyl oligopeptidase family serine peptidase [Parvularcula marina]|uniref:prolyl oligopeptidase n=1 Tax=Parvularcula marina TaxID=2292771 RepID=A0A371RFD4_9PROT|nr:prolyl oligopeptidase family serine peptidase [Parvularcula marina]RFB04152.1 S9 family peptidase [Parvularcula marina]